MRVFSFIVTLFLLAGCGSSGDSTKEEVSNTDRPSSPVLKNTQKVPPQIPSL